MKKDNKLFYASIKFGLFSGLIITMVNVVLDHYNHSSISFNLILFYFIFWSINMGLAYRLATFTGK